MKAKEWLKGLYRDVSSTNHAWHDPLITASEEGEVTFEWWQADRKLTVSVSEEGITSTRITGRRPPLRIEDGIADTSVQKRALWAWLVG